LEDTLKRVSARDIDWADADHHGSSQKEKE